MVGGHPGDGTQLRGEQVGAAKPEAEPADPQEGVLLGRLRGERHGLVATDVEGSHHQATSRHGFGDGAVRCLLLGLVRGGVPAQEDELGAEQADAVGTGGDRGGGFGYRPDVGGHFDHGAVEGDRRLVGQCGGGGGTLPVGGGGLIGSPEAIRVGLGHDLTGAPVDQHQCALRDVEDAPTGGDDGRDAQGAGQDGGVGRRAPFGGEDPGDHLRIESCRLPRVEVDGHQDPRPRGLDRHVDTEHGGEHLAAHRLDVGGASPLVLVLEAPEAACQVGDGAVPRSHSARPAGDGGGHPVEQLGVVEQQEVGIEDPRFRLPRPITGHPSRSSTAVRTSARAASSRLRSSVGVPGGAASTASSSGTARCRAGP